MNARLEALRADDALVAELQARVDSYRALRADGKAEKKSFIRRNRRALSASSDDLLAKRRFSGRRHVDFMEMGI